MYIWFYNINQVSIYNDYRCKFESCSWHGVLDTTLCDKVCQWLETCRWFSPGTLVSSSNKTDRHDITEIRMKVALTTIANQWLALVILHQTSNYFVFILLYNQFNMTWLKLIWQCNICFSVPVEDPWLSLFPSFINNFWSFMM